MDNLIGTLTQQLSGGTVSKIAEQIGANEKTTQTAISAALPMLVTALARNASDKSGATSLHKALAKDHDGGILDNLGSFLGNPAVANGSGILKHVLGGKQNALQSGLAGGTGLDAGSAGKLLAILAPIVMGALGQTQRKKNLDAGSLASFLGGQKGTAAGSGGDLLGSLNRMLDADGDGSALDDVAGLAGKLFGRR